MDGLSTTMKVNILRSISVGLFDGVFLIINALSLALLVLPGLLAVYLPAGTTLTLLSTGIVCLFLGFTSQFRCTIAMAQDTSAVVLLLANVAIAQKIAAIAPQASPLPTIIAGIVLSGIIIGILLFAVGKLQLGNLFRYIPYTVVSGFLAGTGWFVIDGAWAVMVGESLNFSHLDNLFISPLVLQWMPGTVFGIFLFFISKKIKSPHIVFLSFIFSCVLFYVIIFITGSSILELQSLGLLFTSSSPTSLITLYKDFNLLDVRWDVLVNEWQYLIFLAVLTPIGLLLNASGIEIETKDNVDFNHELKVTGIANGAASLVGGGFVSYHSISLPILNQRLGQENKTVILIAGLLCMGALLFGTHPLNYLPQFPFAGLLIFLGIDLISAWLLEIWKKFSIIDCLIVVVIFMVIVFSGFLSGILVGLVTAIIIFAVNYSRINVIKNVFTAAVRHSNVERDEHIRTILESKGDAIYILQLHGFLFFGNANNIITKINFRLKDPTALPVNYVLINFQYVPAIDSSSTLAFQKLINIAEASNIDIVFTSTSAAIRKLLEWHIGPRKNLYFFPDFDHGLEWCEDNLLAKEGSCAKPLSLAESLLECSKNAKAVARLINELDELYLPENSTLIAQGDQSTHMYFIESGRVDVVLMDASGGQIRLRTMNPGNIVGEMGLYLHIPRTASVITKTPCHLYHLSSENLANLEKNHPDLATMLHYYIARQMMLRLIYANNLIEVLL